MNLLPLHNLRYSLEKALQIDGLELYNLVNTTASTLTNTDFKPYIDFYTYASPIESKWSYPDISSTSLNDILRHDTLGYFLTLLLDIQTSKSKRVHGYYNNTKNRILHTLNDLLIKVNSLISYITDDANVRRYYNIPDSYSLLKIDSTRSIYYEQVDDNNVHVFPYYTSYERTSVPTNHRTYTRGDTWFEPDKLISQHIWPEDFL